MTKTADDKSGRAKVTTTTAKKSSLNRTRVLDCAEKLMREEGYAAVSTRRIAREVGLKAPLVHYYFPTTDDLFLAVFRRAVEQEVEMQDAASGSPDGLRKLWNSYRNSDRTALAIEFMALANHRPLIRDEMALYTERTRRRRAELLATLADPDALEAEDCAPLGLAVVMIGVARTLVMEGGLGISLGHDEAIQFVESWLEKLETR